MTNDEPASQPASALTDSPSTRPVIAVFAAVVALVAVVVLCVIAALIPGVPWWVGIPVGLVAAGAYVWFKVARAVDRFLAVVGASPVGEDDQPRLHNLVQGLSLAGGVAEPELHIIDDPSSRNVAVAADGTRSALVATSGLLDALDRIALEGLVAEALVRIRSGDAEAATIGSALFGSLATGPLAVIGRPVAAIGLGRLLSGDRDLSADRAAVALTRYPPGLLSALTEIRAGSAAVPGADGSNEHLWLVPPSLALSGLEGRNDAVIGGAPLDLRIDVLAEL